MRIAAAADLHCTEGTAATLGERFLALNDEADVLLLAGDLSTMGRSTEVGVLCDSLKHLRIPIVAVLGNHDHELDQSEEIVSILRGIGTHVLDGTGAVFRINGRELGVAGVKGFCGGFYPHLLQSFGERELKNFIGQTVHEAEKLRGALARLTTHVRIALLHYAPTKDTLGSEPVEIYPFLGSSLLLEVVEACRVDAVFHGHAHLGVPFARTPSGIPVYNVAMPVTRRPYVIVTL